LRIRTLDQTSDPIDVGQSRFAYLKFHACEGPSSGSCTPRGVPVTSCETGRSGCRSEAPLRAVQRATLRWALSISAGRPQTSVAIKTSRPMIRHRVSGPVGSRLDLYAGLKASRGRSTVGPPHKATHPVQRHDRAAPSGGGGNI
jgi:hypothetical protein